MLTHYDYIITGAGCAGSSLLKRMMQNSFFSEKKILVLDHSTKTQNDRTWCFWEKQEGIFESIVHHQWQKLNFFSNLYSATIDISPYHYKMIRGIDLYTAIKNQSLIYSNIEWRNEKVSSIQNTGNTATVTTNTGNYTADYVFNSILFENGSTPSSALVPSGQEGVRGYLLLQHFKGWLIETPEHAFDPAIATFMDFRVDQKHGTTFIYLMPVSATTALVEYTLFTGELLEKEEYAVALKEYIAKELQLKEYRIIHEEFGVIPMTNRKFPLQDGRIIYTGIAGGQAKGSSGYAFQFIQKRATAIIESLIAHRQPLLSESWNEKKFHLYDSVLLNVLHGGKMKGDEIFARIFSGNPAARVLQFLDNESSLGQDIQVMRSVPTGIFLPAAFKELINLSAP